MKRTLFTTLVMIATASASYGRGHSSQTGNGYNNGTTVTNTMKAGASTIVTRTFIPNTGNASGATTTAIGSQSSYVEPGRDAPTATGHFSCRINAVEILAVASYGPVVRQRLQRRANDERATIVVYDGARIVDAIEPWAK